MTEAFKRLEEFLEAWKARNFEEMFNLCQLTWSSENGVNDIALKFRHCPIDGFEVLDCVENVPGVVADCTFRVKVNEKWTKETTARLICEEAPYKPEKGATWGVNPVSVTKIFSLIGVIRHE